MKCANCGHDISDHSTAVFLEGMRAPCYAVSVVCPDGMHTGEACNTPPMQCLCSNFKMPREEPKPKLCVCGHPATSHAPQPENRYADFGAPGVVIRFKGLCNEAHPNGPYPCWGFTAPEDAKVHSAIGGYEPSDSQESTDGDYATDLLRGSHCRCGGPHAPNLEHYLRSKIRALEAELALAKKEIETDDKLLEGRNELLNHEALLCSAHGPCVPGAIVRVNKLLKKIEELEKWKKEAMETMPDWQAIGKELGLEIGDTVHDKVLMALKKLRQNADHGDECTRAELRAALTLEQERHAGARALLASLADKVEKAMYVSEANHEIWPEKLQRMRKVFERA